MLIGGVTCVVLAALSAWIVAGMIAASELQAAEAEADRLDPRWRFQDVLGRRALILPTENSARTMINVRMAMGGAFSLPGKKVPRAPGLPPIPPRPFVLDRILATPPTERLDIATAAEARRVLRPIGEAVLEARKLANGGMGRTEPKYQFLLWATLLTHVQNSRDVVRLLQTVAAIDAQDGALDDSLDACRAMIGVERSIGDEPFLISQLVRVSILQSALVSAERTLNQGQASDAALSRLQCRLTEEFDQPFILTGLRGERAMMDDVFSKLTTGEISARELVGMGPTSQSSGTEYLASLSTAFVRHNHALVLKRMNAAVEIAKHPTIEQLSLWTEWEKGTNTSDGFIAKVTSALSREALPSLRVFGDSCIRTRVQCYAMILVLSGERHRLAHGQFPGSIHEIDPSFLPRSFLDPYSSQPFVFRLQSDGSLIVYSVGPDGVDDHGQKLESPKWKEKGLDLGFQLSSVLKRGRPPKIDTLPEDVFVFESEKDPEAEVEP